MSFTFDYLVLKGFTFANLFLPPAFFEIVTSKVNLTNKFKLTSISVVQEFQSNVESFRYETPIYITRQ
jgi:hypothetical protein